MAQAPSRASILCLRFFAGTQSTRQACAGEQGIIRLLTTWDVIARRSWIRAPPTRLGSIGWFPGEPRSAGFQSAVSQVFNLQSAAFRGRVGLRPVCRLEI